MVTSVASTNRESDRQRVRDRPSIDPLRLTLLRGLIAG